MRPRRLVVLLSAFVIAHFLSLPAQSQSFMVRNYPPTAGDFLNRGDFNNDGILDIVSFNSEEVQTAPNVFGFNTYLAIYPGKADGTFDPAIRTLLPGPTFGWRDGAVGDFNHDGILDVAAISDSPKLVSVFLGKGDGTFGQATSLPGPPEFPESVTVADFNQDGNLDIAVCCKTIDTEHYAIVIFPGNGHGSFGGPVNSASLSVPGGRQIRVADFNYDGVVDIAVQAENEVVVLLGDGAFNFNATELGGYFDVAAMNPVDVNQDGATDLLISFQGCNGQCAGIDVFLSTGPNHALQRFTTIPVTHSAASSTTTSQVKDLTRANQILSSFQATEAFSPWAADINGDGINDIVASYFDGSYSEVVTWLGNADGTFQNTPSRWIVGTDGPFPMLPGDFNRDGRIDLAASVEGDIRLSVLLNSTPKASCLVRTPFSSITLCTPEDYTYSNSPVHVAAVSTAEPPVVGNPITSSQVYVDDQLAFQADGTQFDTAINLMPGNHFLVAKFLDSEGMAFQAVSHISVFSGSEGETCATQPQTMQICAPAQDGTFPGPLHVLAAARANAPITTLQVYVDNNLIYNDTNFDTYIDAAFNLPAGPHFVEVKAFDANGTIYSATRNVLVQ